VLVLCRQDVCFLPSQVAAEGPAAVAKLLEPHYMMVASLRAKVCAVHGGW
jgi:hypothetical protein